MAGEWFAGRFPFSDTHGVRFTALRDPRAGQEAFGCKPFMHFGFYLMIAALVLIGLEAIYSLYQLATLVL
jgi:hypothetical protein